MHGRYAAIFLWIRPYDGSLIETYSVLSVKLQQATSQVWGIFMRSAFVIFALIVTFDLLRKGHLPTCLTLHNVLSNLTQRVEQPYPTRWVTMPNAFARSHQPRKCRKSPSSRAKGSRVLPVARRALVTTRRCIVYTVRNPALQRSVQNVQCPFCS